MFFGIKPLSENQSFRNFTAYLYYQRRPLEKMYSMEKCMGEGISTRQRLILCIISCPRVALTTFPLSHSVICRSAFASTKYIFQLCRTACFDQRIVLTLKLSTILTSSLFLFTSSTSINFTFTTSMSFRHIHESYSHCFQSARFRREESEDQTTPCLAT